MKAQKLMGALSCALMTIVLVPQAVQARMTRAEKAVVKGINGVRRASGLRPLHGDRRLARAADAHSRDMARRRFFDHRSSNGTDPTSRIKRFERAGAVGETLAYTPLSGRHGGRTVVRMWVRSPGHLAVMRTAGLRRVGVAKRRGVLNGVRVLVWTADYAGA